MRQSVIIYDNNKKNKGVLDSIGIDEKNRYWSLVCELLILNNNNDYKYGSILGPSM